MNKQKGIASMAIMIGILVMAVALPVTTKLVQQNQENRSNAATGTTTCSSYSTGVWGACSNGYQTRIVKGSPSGCSGGTVTKPATSQPCPQAPTPTIVRSVIPTSTVRLITPTITPSLTPTVTPSLTRVDAVCGNAKNPCISGTVSDIDITINSTTNIYKWSCMGKNGGETRSCEMTVTGSVKIISSVAATTKWKVITGSCNTSTGNYVCTSGTDSSHIFTNETACINASGCDVATNTVALISGTCGTTKNACRTGTFSDVYDTKTQYRWNCMGKNGGASVGCVMSR